MQRFERKVNNDGTITFTFDFGHDVSQSNSDKFIRQVLAHRENINLTETEIILLQARNEHWPSILLLISKNEHLKDVNNLLQEFVKNSRWDTVKKMIDAGVDPDTKVNHGKTILHLVLESDSKALRNLDMFKFLLDHGASPNLQHAILNYSVNLCIMQRLQLEKFKILLPYFTNTLNSSWGLDKVLSNAFWEPNYHKFRCLLLHGLRLCPNLVKSGLELMKKKNKPSSPDYWRRNQHKRKMVADIKAWPLNMLLYSLEKRLVPVFLLS